MKIDRNNYETFFIDYLDGVLSPDLISELLLFIDENPDLKEELIDLDTVPLMADETVQYCSKQLLKKKSILSVGPINELNYQEYMIGSVEGDLSVTESRLLDRFVLRNPQVAWEWEQFKSTRLVPDPKVVYPGKSHLRRNPFRVSYIRPLYYITGAAAGLLALLLVIHPFQKKEPYVAEVKTGTPELISDTLPVKIPEVVYTTSGFIEPQVNQQHPSVISEEVPVMENPVNMPISPITPVHKGLHYQLINTSFQPARQLISNERNLYSQVLPYLTASDQYTLSPSMKDKNRSFDSFGELAMNKVKEIFSGKSGDNKRRPDINLWTLADFGVAGINQLTDSELHIQRIKNEEGKIISYALVNEKQEIARTRTKNNSGQYLRFD